MIGDLLTLSAETVTAKLPECKDGEVVEVTVSVTVRLIDGAIVAVVDPASVTKEYSEPMAEEAPVSAGAAAILSRGK